MHLLRQHPDIEVAWGAPRERRSR